MQLQTQFHTIGDVVENIDDRTSKGQRLMVTGPQLVSGPFDPFRMTECAFARDWSMGDDVGLENCAAGGINDAQLAYWHWNYQQLKPYIKKGINQLQGTAKGKTVFLVGCGPSLELNGHLIRRHKDAVVIATNSSIQQIDPTAIDYYGMMDWLGSAITGDKNAWYAGLEDYLPSIKCVSAIYTTPDILSHFNDFYFFSHNIPTRGFETPIRSTMKTLGVLDQGLCVLYSMFHLAYVMEAKNIVFVGADCGYPRGKARPGLWLKRKAGRDYWMEDDIHGNLCATETVYEHIRNHLTAATYFLKKQNPFIRVINASEEGLLYGQGIEQWRLKDVYDILLGGEKDESQSIRERKIQRQAVCV